MQYSILMSVYYKDVPRYFDESIQSMLDQTYKTNDFVIVCDGELTPGLEEVLVKYQEIPYINIVRLEENIGLGKALNHGLNFCKNDLVARMDSDDISVPDRCERQLAIMKNKPEISIVGSHVEEFVGEPSKVIAIKKVPLGHDEIMKMVKKRNPFNHPTVMFRKKNIIEAGNYLDCKLNEDYYLWIRVLKKGYLTENIDANLVKMRVNDDTYMRRGGWKYFKEQKKIFKYMYKEKMINFFQYAYQTGVRFIIRVIVPNKIRKKFYLKYLREEV